MPHHDVIHFRLMPPPDNTQPSKGIRVSPSWPSISVLILLLLVVLLVPALFGRATQADTLTCRVLNRDRAVAR